MKNGSALHSPMKDLRQDLSAVARDTEALLKATAEVTGERVQEARERAQETLRTAVDHLYDKRMQRRLKRVAHTTDSYVRDHSWTIIGAAAGIALIVGLLSNRRH
jgi:ElaB/YqjD/DUF883 family membrane-anchored ribosome-binding protein